MFAKYVYNTASDVANVIQDIVDILTGETDKANLSAACKQSDTEIISTIAAGWTLHDDTAGTNAQVLKAPLADDPATFKYLKLNAVTTSYLRTEVWETWDEVAHSGTNMAYDSNNTSYSQRLDLTDGGTLYVFASARFAAFVSQTAAGYGHTSYSGVSGCFEHTRDLPFDTVANGWPPYCWGTFGRADYNASYFGYKPRKLTKDETTQTGSAAIIKLTTIGHPSQWTSALSGIDQKLPDGQGGLLVPFFPAYLADTNYMPAPYGEISSLCDIWSIPSNIATHLDVITKSSVDYICMKQYASTQLVVFRKS